MVTPSHFQEGQRCLETLGSGKQAACLIQDGGSGRNFLAEGHILDQSGTSCIANTCHGNG